MKKFVIASVMFLGLASPSYAWYDAYGGFTCGYLDPLTSVLDSIFGPPCPAPVAVPVRQVIPQPVPVPVPPQGVIVPNPYTNQAPPTSYGYYPNGGGCGPVPCGAGGLGGGVVGPGVGYGVGIPGPVYDSGLGHSNLF